MPISLPSGTKSPPVSVTVTTSATLLAAGNTGRRQCMLQNVGTQDVWLGSDNTVTVSTGVLLAAGGGILTDTMSPDAWYGIVASGTSDVRVLRLI